MSYLFDVVRYDRRIELTHQSLNKITFYSLFDYSSFILMYTCFKFFYTKVKSFLYTKVMPKRIWGNQLRIIQLRKNWIEIVVIDRFSFTHLRII